MSTYFSTCKMSSVCLSLSPSFTGQNIPCPKAVLIRVSMKCLPSPHSGLVSLSVCMSVCLAAPEQSNPLWLSLQLAHTNASLSQATVKALYTVGICIAMQTGEKTDQTSHLQLSISASQSKREHAFGRYVTCDVSLSVTKPEMPACLPACLRRVVLMS